VIDQLDRTSSGPLDGVRVVELAGIGPAQLGALVLADLGAEVVRVDRATDVPDPMPDQPSPELLNRGRRSIALDLRQADDREVAWALIERADVLVDPYRPGVMERLGLGPEPALERNPRLVFARMTGWGQTGPLAGAAGHDINYIALAGALGQIGPADGPPVVPVNLVGDFGGGAMLLVAGVLAALLERAGSGRGQVLDAAMVDGTALLMTSIFQGRAMNVWEAGRGRNWLQGAAPWYRPYRTADDRYLTVGPMEPKFYALLLERLALDPADWPQHDKARWPALAERMAATFASRTLAQWRTELEGSDVCFAPVLGLDELADDPQLSARGTYVEYEGILQPAPAPRFSRTPAAIPRPPAWPGQHSDEIIAELRLTRA
jgi:alpha-methylacyl-CoA racemase